MDQVWRKRSAISCYSTTLSCVLLPTGRHSVRRKWREPPGPSECVLGRGLGWKYSLWCFKRLCALHFQCKLLYVWYDVIWCDMTGDWWFAYTVDIYTPNYAILIRHRLFRDWWFAYTVDIYTPNYAILIRHRLFRAVDGTYRCKWHVPVDSLEVLEPDYQNDIWDYFVDSESGIYTYVDILIVLGAFICQCLHVCTCTVFCKLLVIVHSKWAFVYTA